VLGGVRSIEHGMLLDEETMKLMLDRGTYLCPTLMAYVASNEITPTETLKKVVVRHKDTFQRAIKMHLKIAFGTDVGSFEHGTSAREFQLMVDYGMQPIDAIRAATVSASELLRMEKEIGTIEAGKYADLIAVDGNPIQDISVLKRVRFVMKAGHVYKNQ
jgi:imidazolonepropionase-like amidohydrolase